MHQTISEWVELFIYCPHYFALYALFLGWTSKTRQKLTGKKNKVSVNEYALKCANILSLSAFYYYLIFADSPLTLLKEGNFNKSNIIIGVTKDDGTVFANGFSGWTELTWF